MQTKINLDTIREAISTLKQRNNCRASEVTADEIRSELRFNGSHSTSGPMICSMMDEAILVEHLDYEKLSSRLKAAYMSEIRRVADISTSELRSHLAESTRINDDLRDKCNAISKELGETKLRSTSDQSVTIEKISELEKLLAEASGKVSTFDEIKQSLLSQLDEKKSDLNDKCNEISDLKNDLTGAKSREELLKLKLEDTTDRFSKAETDCHAFEKRCITAESKVSPLEVRVKELETENKRLVDQCEKLADYVKTLHKELLETAQAKADASARLELMTDRTTRTRQNGSSKRSQVTKTDA